MSLAPTAPSAWLETAHAIVDLCPLGSLHPPLRFGVAGMLPTNRFLRSARVVFALVLQLCSSSGSGVLKGISSHYITMHLARPSTQCPTLPHRRLKDALLAFRAVRCGVCVLRKTPVPSRRCSNSYRAKEYAMLLQKAAFVSGRDNSTVERLAQMVGQGAHPGVTPEDVRLVRDPVLSDKTLTDTSGACWTQSTGV